MEAHTDALYLQFDQERKKQEALQADLEDEIDLAALENQIKKRRQK
jgi:hypothetical protein